MNKYPAIFAMMLLLAGCARVPRQNLTHQHFEDFAESGKKKFEDFVLYDPGPGMLLLEDWNFFNLENFLDIIDLPIVLL